MCGVKQTKNKQTTNISIYLILYSYMIWLMYRSFLCPKEKKLKSFKYTEYPKAQWKWSLMPFTCYFFINIYRLARSYIKKKSVFLKSQRVQNRFIRHGMKFFFFGKKNKTPVKEKCYLLAKGIKKAHLYTNRYFYKMNYVVFFLLHYWIGQKHDMPWSNK